MNNIYLQYGLPTLLICYIISDILNYLNYYIVLQVSYQHKLFSLILP